MAYEKPKCECGEDLYHWSQPIYTRIVAITKRGKFSKIEDLEYQHANTWDRLKCLECYSEYWIDYDEKDRVIRGEVFNPYSERVT